MLYEIGAAFGEGTESIEEPEKTAVERAIALYTRCNGEASSSVMCWLWLAGEKHMCKDIRLVIADLIWNDRAELSDALWLQMRHCGAARESRSRSDGDR